MKAAKQDAVTGNYFKQLVTRFSRYLDVFLEIHEIQRRVKPCSTKDNHVVVSEQRFSDFWNC